MKGMANVLSRFFEFLDVIKGGRGCVDVNGKTVERNAVVNFTPKGRL
jgi:hypothetical protein